MRFYWVVIGLVGALFMPFLLWSDSVETFFTLEGTLVWLRGFGAAAALAAVLLLISDLVLPIPATVVMAALGAMYGPVAGGVIAAFAAFVSGGAAYMICFLLGRPAAEYLVDDAEFARGEALFDRWGGWMVALSRWLPVFPEAIACLAGLTRMPPRTFLVALACGVVPLGFAFALVGHLGVDRPVPTLLVSALAPALLWVVVRPWIRRTV